MKELNQVISLYEGCQLHILLRTSLLPGNRFRLIHHSQLRTLQEDIDPSDGLQLWLFDVHRPCVREVLFFVSKASF